MNSIETEDTIRNLELMLGPDAMRRERVPSDCPTTTNLANEEPEFVVEIYHIGPNGEMSVGRKTKPI